MYLYIRICWLNVVLGGLMAVWGGLVEVCGGLGCFGVVWGVSMDVHFLVVCSRFQFVSQNFIRRLKGILYLENSEIIADSYISNPEKLTQIILDCSVYGARGILSFFLAYVYSACLLAHHLSA